MAYLLDGVLILLFVLAIWLGHKRGFIKTVTGVVAFIAAVAVASLLSGPVAQFVYDNTVEPTVVETIDSYTAAATGSLESGVDEALSSLPGFVTNLLANGGIASGADVLAKVGNTADAAALGQNIADNVVEPLVIPLLKMIATLILFILAYILASLLLRVLNVVAKLPLLKQVNKSLGTVAGVLSGALWVLFAVSVLQVVAAVAGSDFVINPALLADTIVTNWLIGINPLGGMLNEIIAVVD